MNKPSLTTLVEQLKYDFPQESIPLKLFNFQTRQEEMCAQPKYFFRGERSADWLTSKSTFSRSLLNHDDFREINYFITGKIYPTGMSYSDSRYSLYHFLREGLYNISGFDELYDNPKIDEAIAGLLQHYGFDTAFLDITSDIQIAAAFASTGEPGTSGQVMVIASKNIENQYFDLSQLMGNRPKIQSAYALWGGPELDLKSKEFEETSGCLWFPFTLTTEDKVAFDRSEILSVKNDQVAAEILQWYELYVPTHPAISSTVASYFEKKIKALKAHL